MGKKIFKNGIFPNGIVNSGLFTAVKGFIGTSNPIVGGVIGAVQGAVKGAKDKVVTAVENNKASVTGGKGSRDWAEILGAVTGAITLLVTLYLLVTGQISISEFTEANTIP